MVYLTLLLLVLAILFTYKKLNYVSTRFMYGIIIGWVLSFVSFILYLSKFNYYYNMISSVFDFAPGTWNSLVLTNFDPNMLIRMLNGGVLLFNFSLLGFAISFSRVSKRQHNKAIYLTITAITLSQFIFYDPTVQIWLQHTISSSIDPWAAYLKQLVMILTIAFRYINYAYLIVAFGLMVNFYFNYPKIKIFKNYALYHLLILSPVAIIHMFSFSWAPKNMVIATYLKGYYNYLQPTVFSNAYVFKVVPYLVIVALIFMIYMMYRYSSIESSHRNSDIQISHSIDTASLGIKAFTHSLKNHLLAIQFEAEYLKEKHKDEQSHYSLDLILSSCNRGMQSISYAASKLQSIELNLQPLKVDSIIQSAVSRIHAEQAGLSIHTKYDKDIPLCYMDSHYMDEVIYNLLENAAESLSKQDNGVIEIEVGESNNWAIISIRDNGPGIASEHLEMIFTPFFTTKASVNNWGIGLSYCHKVVKGHDGKILAESSPEKGTTFKIFLPIV